MKCDQSAMLFNLSLSLGHRTIHDRLARFRGSIGRHGHPIARSKEWLLSHGYSALDGSAVKSGCLLLLSTPRIAVSSSPCSCGR
eukprot:756732-Hanusia_phi.AAC.17